MMIMQSSRNKTTTNQIAMLAAATAFGGIIITGSGLFPRINLMWKLLIIMYHCLSQAIGDSSMSLLTEPLTLLLIAIMGGFGGLFMAIINRMIAKFSPYEQTASA